MYELRILSGLHRGATLPLDDRPHVIGAGDDDDVVLVDPGIEAQHATLSRTDSGWLLSATNGTLCGSDSNQPQTVIDLSAGDFARLGKVWISVVPQDARWENPPPEPVDLQFTAADEMPARVTGDVAAAVDASSALAASASGAGAQRGARRIYRGWRVAALPVALIAVLSAAAAYAITSRPVTSVAPRHIDRQWDVGLKSAPQAGNHAASAATDATKHDAKPSTGAAGVLSPAELRTAFRKRLADADLLKRFDLTLNDQSWTMQGALDDEETKRFERILTAFMSTHNITFPVHAKVGSAEMMLPFTIRQVISGANASIVTQDGARLYVGDEYLGVRIVAIQANRLTLAGKRKIEVNW